MDYPNNIPAYAYLNMLVIQHAIRSEQFRAIQTAALRECCPDQDLSSYRVINPAYAISVIYCLIVVPKERWDLSANHAVYRDLEKLDPLQYWDVRLKRPAFDTHPVYYLVHHLRNSVAHANFTCRVNEGFVFFDRKNKTSPNHFEAAPKSDEALAGFLSTVGAYLANMGLAISPSQ